MSKDAKFAIMLLIDEGMSHRLPFKMENLKDDNIVAVIDEINNKLWVWMGKSTGLVQRRGSMRAARSLKAYGHEIANSVIGRNLDDVIDIRGDSLETDPEQQNRFNVIMNLVNTPHTFKIDDVLAQYDAVELGSSNIKYGLTTEQRSNLVKAALASPSAGDDSRKIEEIVGEFRPAPPPESSTAKVIPKYAQPGSVPTAPIPQAVSPPRPSIDARTAGDLRAGLVITSILSEINEVFLGVSSQANNVRLFKVEGPNGEICKFTVEGESVKFQEGSWQGVDPNQKNKIQQMIVEKSKFLS